MAWYCLNWSSDDGLRGESVLLPLETAKPSIRSDWSKAMLKSQARCPVQQFDAVGIEDEAEGDVLDNCSEMMSYTTSDQRFKPPYFRS
ncbi:unnamed protein product [Phytophthora fragariaefolia]|uniref:Unnamed protein product n=1 Tax=Phytophthora fragariaefolia TaxID=1490495 RepID=A0A9W6YNZ8_9STRA|nr:unnamed protein product [Phytophthora fragariaefolia]